MNKIIKLRTSKPNIVARVHHTHALQVVFKCYPEIPYGQEH